jgi:hypothetical protein
VTTISVPERGEVELTSNQWAALRREGAFWDLVEARTVDVKQRRGGRAQLRGSSNVGRALCGDIIVECQEKVPGALLALLRAVTVEFRTLPVPAPMTELGDTVALIVRAFVAEVRRYVGAGREWRYEQRRMVSSLAGGRLSVPATISLRSRGLRHLMAFDTPTVTRAIEINRVIFAALREVEVLAKLVGIDPDTVAAARAMSLFFEDCRDAESVFATRAALVQRVNDVLDDSVWSRHRMMLSLAGVLLSHGSFEPVSPMAGTVPLSWFVNLETLFERAVGLQLASVCGKDAMVSAGSSHRRMVFPVVGASQASPDLVVQTASETLVGDVKYKTWTQAASPGDLYQLLVHASAFDSTGAFLIFPSDRFDKVELNVATTGARVWLFAIDIRSITSDLQRVCSDLAIRAAS